MPRKSFSEFDLASALEWVGILETEAWEIPAATKEPSAFFEEAGQPYTNLRIFGETTIQGERNGGLLDYLVTPRGVVPTAPFVCVTEAKKDDFDKGLAQCLVEMQMCAELNTKGGGFTGSQPAE